MLFTYPPLYSPEGQKEDRYLASIFPYPKCSECLFFLIEDSDRLLMGGTPLLGGEKEEEENGSE